MDEDGVTPLWIKWAAKWPPAESAFKAHGAAIAAYREVAAATPGFVYTVFCPPYMSAKGAPSSPRLPIRVNRPGVSASGAGFAALRREPRARAHTRPLPPRATIPPQADFISFEDAAYTMMEAATSTAFDNQLITCEAAPAAAKAEL